MKCHMMQHFIRVPLFAKMRKNTFFLEIITYDTRICTMDCPKFNVSKMKEESISAYRVNGHCHEDGL